MTFQGVQRGFTSEETAEIPGSEWRYHAACGLVQSGKYLGVFGSYSTMEVSGDRNESKVLRGSKTWKRFLHVPPSPSTSCSVSRLPKVLGEEQWSRRWERRWITGTSLHSEVLLLRRTTMLKNKVVPALGGVRDEGGRDARKSRDHLELLIFPP